MFPFRFSFWSFYFLVFSFLVFSSDALIKVQQSKQQKQSFQNTSNSLLTLEWHASNKSFTKKRDFVKKIEDFLFVVKFCGREWVLLTSWWQNTVALSCFKNSFHNLMQHLTFKIRETLQTKSKTRFETNYLF